MARLPQCAVDALLGYAPRAWHVEKDHVRRCSVWYFLNLPTPTSQLREHLSRHLPTYETVPSGPLGMLQAWVGQMVTFLSRV